MSFRRLSMWPFFEKLLWCAPAASRSLLVAFGCAQCVTPTSIVVDVMSQVPCDRNAEVTLVVGTTPSDLASRPPSAVATRCEAAEAGLVHRGSVVIVPASRGDESVALAVITRNDAAPIETTCSDAAGWKGCIVARRKARFVRQQEITIPVTLDLRCVGVVCSTEMTCDHGDCVALGYSQ